MSEEEEVESGLKGLFCPSFRWICFFFHFGRTRGNDGAGPGEALPGWSCPRPVTLFGIKSDKVPVLFQATCSHASGHKMMMIKKRHLLHVKVMFSWL